MEFLSIAALLVIATLALFVTGVLAQPHGQRGTAGEFTPRAVWSTVARGNRVLAPTTPYGQFARRS